MIYSNPRNPRKNFDPDAMGELVASVRQVGILQPVVVVRDEDETTTRYRLVAGERRWRAAREACVTVIPAVIRELTPEQELEVMIIENLQRRDIDPIEEAQGMKALLDEGGYTQEALAEKLSCSQGHIANRLRLLRLPDEVKEDISRKIISAGHAHALLKLEKAPAIMEKAAEAIAQEQVPVSKAAEAIGKVIAEEGKPLFNDYNCKPEFKTEQCEECESRVMGNRWGHGEGDPYCIKPSCWEKKQQEMKQDRERALADRVKKLAKKGQGVVNLDKFTWDQFEEFRDYKTKDMDLSECQDCEHKKTSKSSHSDELIETCFQPSCFKKKQAAVTREKNKEARDAFKEEVNKITILAGMKALSMVRHLEYADPDKNTTEVALNKLSLVYLAAVILANVKPWYERKVTLFRYLQDKFGWEHDVLKRGDYGLIKNEWDSFRQLLETLTEQQLLELIFEWPAIACSLDGAMGWVLQQQVTDLDGQCSQAVSESPRVYLDEKGQEIFVSTGLGDEYGSFRRSPSGGLHRVKSPAMPLVATQEEAQVNLDAWAAKKGLKTVEGKVVAVG